MAKVRATYANYVLACKAFVEAFTAASKKYNRGTLAVRDAAMEAMKDLYERMPDKHWLKSPGEVRGETHNGIGNLDENGKALPPAMPMAFLNGKQQRPNP